MAHSMWVGIAEGKAVRKAAVAAMEDLPDTTLLDRFFAQDDGAAFGALVRRHGSKVRGVCRRWLGDGQDADDAFQATFMVLVRRAGEARRLDDLGSWLCGVARRVAARSKIQSERRRTRETAAVDVRNLAGPAKPEFDDAPPLLRAEVDRLPERFRRPIQLCYWEGLTSEQAAERLGCPTGTLKWRLTRGREILKSRLSRLGIAMAAFFLFWRPSTGQAASAAVQAGGGAAEELVGPGPDPDALPTELVQETVSLATIARDKLLYFMWDDANPLVAGARRPRRFWVYVLAPLAAAVAFGLLFALPGWIMTGQPAFRLSQAINTIYRVVSTTQDSLFPPESSASCH